MGQEGTNSREGSIVLIRLIIMRTLGGEHVIVGRDYNGFINNYTAE